MLTRLVPSVGTVGDANDNALCENTIGLYKTECVRDGSPFRNGPIRTLADLEDLTSAYEQPPLFSTRLPDSARGLVRECVPAGVETMHCRADRRRDGDFEDFLFGVPGGGEAVDVGVGDLV
jgi:hypothetical protein